MPVHLQEQLQVHPELGEGAIVTLGWGIALLLLAVFEIGAVLLRPRPQPEPTEDSPTPLSVN